MLLYLCSNQNINLFDYLDTENQIPIKKLVGTFNLKQFVIHDVKSLSQFSYFLIDLKALKDTETEIIEAITAFKAMYNSRVIVLAEGMDAYSNLINKLIESWVYNIITSTEYEEIKEEMHECMSLQGKNSRNVIWSMTRTTEAFCSGSDSWGSHGYNFLCKDIKIAVVGAEHKVGTTTTAFHLVRFLADYGAETAYVEANKNGHLQMLSDFYNGMKVKDAFVEYEGTKYYFEGNYPDNNNFVVIDFGTISECKLQVVKQCEVIVICGCAKPYEIEQVKSAIEKFEGIKVNLVLSHVQQEERATLDELLKKPNITILYADDAPTLFDGKANEVMFKELVKDYIFPVNDEET